MAQRKEVKANWNMELQIYIANADECCSPCGRSALNSDEYLLVCGRRKTESTVAK